MFMACSKLKGNFSGKVVEGKLGIGLRSSDETPFGAPESRLSTICQLVQYTLFENSSPKMQQYDGQLDETRYNNEIK